MPQSIYDNGGMIGVTLDFGDTDTYPSPPIFPEAGLTLTDTKSASTSILPYSLTQRSQNAVFSATVTFPASPSDGCLFEWGRNAVGVFVGLRDGGTVFRVRAGDGDALGSSNALCALLDITDFPTDGAAHNVTVDFQINPGRVRLWIDGIFKGESFTVGNGPLESNTWAGGANGAYLSGSADNGPIGEPVVAWPGIEQGSGLRFYENQLVLATPALGNLKNSGIWSLTSVLETVTAPLEFISATTQSANATSMSVPSGLQAGDLLVYAFAADVAASNLGSTPSIPTGFTLGQGVGGTSGGMVWAYKIADGSETTISPIDNGRNVENIHAAFIFRNAAISSTGSTQVTIDSTITPPSISAISGEYVIILAAQDSASATATGPAGYTEIVDATGTDVNLYIGYKQVTSAGIETPGPITFSQINDNDENDYSATFTIGRA